MRGTQALSQRAAYGGIIFALLLAIILPIIASAAQVTQRSITLSSSSVSATGVTYGVEFTPAEDAGAFVVDFCSNSPIVGQTCTAPTGFNASTASSTTSGFTDVVGSTSQVIVTGAMTEGAAVSVDVAGITNPSEDGVMYARIVTYDTKANAQNYTSELTVSTGKVDDGGVALSITPTIGVSGLVLESLTFCVSKVAIPDNCETLQAPVMQLGETVGSTVALTPGVLSTDTMHTQISTNAVSGAVVRLKSSAVDCGGLLRAGALTACDIEPALDQGIDAGANEAKFGVRTATATDTGGGATSNGTFQPVTGSIYNNTTYAMNYVAGNTAGVTSIYGDPFLETDGAPINAKNMELTFGATVSNNTPAGLYSADLSMIAVGKF